MPNKNIIAILCLILFPLVLSAQTGKIAGKATDLESKEPLIGATVKIVGTTLGASTDLNGNYVILNVPIGTYTMESNYIGYKKITISNIRVSSNQTTDRNFQLPSDAYKLEIITDIVAQKPLVDKNPNTGGSSRNQEEIQNLPVRGVDAIVALSANVIDQGGLHIGGSRGDQVDFRVDGVSVKNPVSGGRMGIVINNAMEEINVQAGGYSAEFGNANGGIVNSTTRLGGPKLQITGEVITDAWSKPGTKALGTYAYGINQYVLTAGGPIAGPLKFFVAGQSTFQKSPVQFWNGYDLSKYYDAFMKTDLWQKIYNENKYYVVDHQFDNKAGNVPLSVMQNGTRVPLTDSKGKQLYGPINDRPVYDPITGKVVSYDATPIQGIFDPGLSKNAKVTPFSIARSFLGNGSQNYAVQGNFTADMNPISLRFSGSYDYAHSRGGIGLTSQLDQARVGVSESEDLNASMKFTHMLSEKTFYELTVGYLRTFGVSYDPDLQNNITMYGDSIANAAYGYYLRGDGIEQLTRNVFGNAFLDYGYPLANYGKNLFQQITGKLGFVHQIGRVHEIKFGGEVQAYTIRTYSPGRTFDIKSYWRNNPQASILDFQKNSSMDNYGYDAWGNLIDTGTDAPKKPVFAGIYLLDKIELEDLILNLGLRYDLFDTDSKVFKNPNNITYNQGTIDDINFEPASVSQTISPRLGFSFPVTDQTVFYAQYGKFVNQSRLRDIYQGRALMAFNIQGGYAIQNPVGFGLRPERTTQYDIGFRQQIGDNFSFDIGARYADVKGQVQMRQIPADPSAQHGAYYAWVNGDFQTTVSGSIKLTLRRIERLQATADYTYSDARATGSTPSGSFRSIWQAPTGIPYFPNYATAVDWDQTHRGAVNIDYRYGTDDGPRIGTIYPLERVGFNVLFTFNSGHPYTAVDPKNIGQNASIPIEEINASRTPWVFQIDARLDKSFKAGPLDMNVYIWVLNVLNTKNVTSVYAATGTATDDGWLASPNGQSRVDQYKAYGDVFAQAYLDYYGQYLANAGNYGAPRQIRLGFRFNF